MMLVTPPRAYKLAALFCGTLTIFGLTFLLSYLQEETCNSTEMFAWAGMADPNWRKILTAGRSVCTNDVKYVAVVHSSPKNSELRKAIRDTWGNRSVHNIPVMFMLGLSTNDTETRVVNEEVMEYDDLVIGDFIDDYHNLTWKHLMALKWTREHCSVAKFLLKFDDDIVVQLKRLVSYLDRIDQNRSTIICDSVEKGVVQRKKSSKWCISRSLYKNETYPTYCNGYCIVYPVEAVEDLLNVASRNEYFWIDDVFITGILAQEAGLRRARENLFLSPHEYLSKIVSRSTHSGKARRVFMKRLVGPSEVHQASELRRLWKLTPS